MNSDLVNEGDLCEICGEPIKEDGTGCQCVVTSATCVCGESAPADVIADDDLLLFWIEGHTEHGDVEVDTAILH